MGSLGPTSGRNIWRTVRSFTPSIHGDKICLMTKEDKIWMMILSILQERGGRQSINDAAELEPIVTATEEDCIRVMSEVMRRYTEKEPNSKNIKKICKKDIVISSDEFWTSLYALSDDDLVDAFETNTIGGGRQLFKLRINARGEEYLEQFKKSGWRQTWEHLWAPKSRAEIIRTLIIAAIAAIAAYLFGRYSGGTP